MDLPSGSFRLEGDIDVPPEKTATILNALANHIELTRAESGCIFFNVVPCEKVQGRFLVSEAFVDQAAFDFHQERSKTSDWASVSAGLQRHYKTWTV